MSKVPLKVIILALLILICAGMTYHCHFIRGSDVVFTHFFYIPLVLAGFWWGKRAIWVAVFLGGWLLASHALSGLDISYLPDILRCGLFIVAGLVVGALREQTLKTEEEIQRLNRELETIVEERTKELAKERDYTRHLIESSPDFQMTLDKEGRITDVNEAFEEIVDRGRGDIIGRSIYEYWPRQETEKLIAAILEKKKVRNIELTMDTPEKRGLICNFSGTLFITPEGDTGTYLSGRNITELKKQQEELLSRERQIAHTARLSSLGEMATSMAHEINQPLTLISMAAEGISRDIRKNRVDMKLLPQDLGDILTNVKRIDRLITHMRTFARQSGEWRVIKPERILNNAFIIVGEQFRVHGVSVSRHIEENLPPIEVDPNQLEQVFITILTNARQVLDEKGEEAKRADEGFQKQLVCGIVLEGDSVVFEFADNAYGVPDEIKSRIFEPFFTTKDPGQGTGLGLSIAYSIATNSLNGRIWVEDNELGGASFKVAMPVKKRERRIGE